MPKKVLIVDDSRSVRMQVGYTLREAGFKVIEAKDGQEGLRLLQQHPDLAVIIADINMPELDGISMTEKIKAGGSGVPVLILTTETVREVVEKAREAGAVAFITKPFQPEQLVRAVKKIISPG